MKDMNEFRRTVYEKAENKAAEERMRKLKLKKFVVFAACFALIIAPALVALKTSSKDKSEEIYYEGGSTPAAGKAEDGSPGGGYYGEATKATFYDNPIEEEAEGTTPKYTTTRPRFTAASTAVTTRVQTTVATTTPLLSGTEPVPTLTQYIPDTTTYRQAGTAGGIFDDFADVKIGGKLVALKKGMSYAEIRNALGGEGEEVSGASGTYSWKTDDATLAVRFEVVGSDEKYSERLKAVYFTAIR